MLDSIENTTSMYPWESRKEVLFGRFAHYHRMVDPEEPSLQRQGTRGANICRVSGEGDVCTLQGPACFYRRRREGSVRIRAVFVGARCLSVIGT